MLLVMDIGNTNIKVGLFDNNELALSWRMTTDQKRTSDEYGIQMEAFFAHAKLSNDIIDGAIYSSVTPSINYTIEHMFQLFFPNMPYMVVDHEKKCGLINKYDHPELLGADRICNAAAANKIYGGPCVVIDFGTATSFSVVSAENEFLGGLICPGIRVATNALVESAAMLPKVKYYKPDKVIATNTEDAMQSGIFNGYVGQVEYIIKKINEDMGGKIKVIATGGMSDVIALETDSIDIVDPTLTLKGLALIYSMNKQH